MALFDLIIRQAKSADKDYTIGDADGLALQSTSKAASRGTSDIAGPANKNECRWAPAPTPRSASGKRTRRAQKVHHRLTTSPSSAIVCK
ncbi:hypothetical protein [Achromobacter aloeverae]